MKRLLFIFCFISVITAQFEPSNTQYKGFSKINCLGLIISGLEDELLLSKIEKSFFSIAEKTLTKQIKSAVKSNCDILVIVGSEEISNNILTIKDLRSDRDDMSISFDDFSKFIEEY